MEGIRGAIRQSENLLTKNKIQEDEICQELPWTSLLACFFNMFLF